MSLAASLALFVGMFRLLIGVLRFGSLAGLVCQPVLLGFTTAAALLMLFSQLPKSLGIEAGDRSVINGAIYSLSHPQDWFWPAILIAAVSIAIMRLGRRLHPLFPGVLMAVLLGLLVTAWLPYNGVRVGNIPSLLPQLTFAFPWTHLPSIMLGAFIIALVGFAEPASIARSYAMRDKMPWSAHQEFISQGVANITAGLVGGFPVDGSFSRTSLNRLAGAQSRVSGLVTGLCVLAFGPFSSLLSGLPAAVLGAIVITAVLHLLKFKDLWQLREYSKSQAYIAWFTFVACLVLAPRIDIAILTGIGIAVAHHLRREQRLVIDSWLEANTINIQPKGVLWFGSISSFEREVQHLLAQHPAADAITLHLEGLGRIDLSAAITLQELIKRAQETGLKINLENIPPMAVAWSERLWQEQFKPPAS
jgi:SulP family sulfate permease